MLNYSEQQKKKIVQLMPPDIINTELWDYCHKYLIFTQPGKKFTISLKNVYKDYKYYLILQNKPYLLYTDFRSQLETILQGSPAESSQISNTYMLRNLRILDRDHLLFFFKHYNNLGTK